MECRGCKSKFAYQPFLGGPECPNTQCEYFSPRRFDEVFKSSGPKLTLLANIDLVQQGYFVRVLWGTSIEARPYNGLYKVEKIVFDRTNLVEAVHARKTDQKIDDKEYVFTREYIHQAFKPEEPIINNETFPFLAWDTFKLP